MRIWSIQSEEVLEIVQRDGIFFSDFDKSPMMDLDLFYNAYNWMTGKMLQKIESGNKNAKYPIGVGTKRMVKTRNRT